MGGEIDSSQARDWSSQPVWSLPAPFKEHMGSCRTRRHRSESQMEKAHKDIPDPGPLPPGPGTPAAR